MRFLNKVSGGLLGSVLYPLKSIVVNVSFLFAFLTLAIVANLALPFFAAIYMLKKHHSILKSLTVLMLVFALLPLLSILVGVAFVVTLVPFSIKDFFINARRGLVDGSQQGLFFHVVRTAVYEFRMFSQLLDASIDKAQFIRRALSRGVAPAAQQSPYQYDTYFREVSPQQMSPPLTDTELEAVKNTPALAVLLSRYQDLKASLDILDQAIKRRKKSKAALQLDEKNDLEDEIIIMLPVVSPVLVLKECQISSEVWQPVSGTTHISCEKNLRRFFSTRTRGEPPRHPIDGMPFLNGAEVLNEDDGSGHSHAFSAADEPLTRYSIYKYHTQADSVELSYLVQTIRAGTVSRPTATAQTDHPRLSNAQTSGVRPFFCSRRQPDDSSGDDSFRTTSSAGAAFG
jgi:hypothetical protein